MGSNECAKTCKLSEFFNNECILVIDNFKAQKNNIHNIIKEIENNVNAPYIEKVKNKDEIIIREKNLIYQLTSSENENNKYFSGNISIIKLGECENLLKDKYDIPKNDILIIFKYEYLYPDLLIPYIGFEVFHPYTGKKLDISICETATINYYIPVNIKENELYKYNKSSDYYEDRCTPATTENGTDIILYDRKYEFNNNHLSLCAKGCNLIQYNSTTKNALCECNVKNNPIELDSLIDKQKLLNNFIDIKMI